MDAITTPPAPVNEPNLNYAPGSPERAGIEAELAHAAAAGPIDLTATIGGRKVMGGGAEIEVVQPHEHKSVLGVLKNSTKRDAQAAVQGRERGGAGLARAVVRRPRLDPAQGSRPAGRPVARPAQRGHDARPVEDGLAGRDRRGVRADRLLAVQRPLRPADHGRSADREQPRCLEPHRPPPARGFRLRDHAVQLHRDRRQPADCAGTDGQHGDLEAVTDAAVRGAPDDGAARGGRPAPGRDQHAARRRHRGLRRGAAPPRPGRHPLHRLDADLPEAVGHGGGEPPVVPHLPAHRRRDRRQGLHRRPPVGRRRRAAGGDDPRCLRVPGTEVLGRVACLRARRRCGRSSRTSSSRRPRTSRWATSPTCRTSWAR